MCPARGRAKRIRPRASSSAQKGATTATVIDNSTDTRFVTEYDGHSLCVARPKPARQRQSEFYQRQQPYELDRRTADLIGGPRHDPHRSAGVARFHGRKQWLDQRDRGTANGVNNSRIGKFVYLSPEEYFFANSDTLYVADSGQPKNGNADNAALGEGGLQKWSLVDGVWTLDYDLVAGLDLVDNANANSNTPTAPGVTGLFGLTAEVVGNQVELFATSYGLNELSPSYLYEITDTLSDTTIAQASGETFTTLYSAPDNISIRGVSFAPSVPEPATWAMMALGFAGLGFAGWRRTTVKRALA